MGMYVYKLRWGVNIPWEIDGYAARETVDKAVSTSRK